MPFSEQFYDLCPAFSPEKEYVVSSGGGMVEVTVTGKHEVKAIGINPEVVA